MSHPLSRHSKNSSPNCRTDASFGTTNFRCAEWFDARYGIEIEIGHWFRWSWYWGWSDENWRTYSFELWCTGRHTGQTYSLLGKVRPSAATVFSNRWGRSNGGWLAKRAWIKSSFKLSKTTFLSNSGQRSSIFSCTKGRMKRKTSFYCDFPAQTSDTILDWNEKCPKWSSRAARTSRTTTQTILGACPHKTIQKSANFCQFDRNCREATHFTETTRCKGRTLVFQSWSRLETVSSHSTKQT